MIKLVQGFDIGSPLPIDGRILLSKREMKGNFFEDPETLQRYDLDNILPEHYFAFCKDADDNRLYLFNKNNESKDTEKEIGKFVLADKAVLDKINSNDKDIRDLINNIKNQLDSDIDDLSEELESNVALLNTAINDEKQRALAAEEELTNKVNKLRTDLTSLDNRERDNVSRIDDELESLSSNLALETNTREENVDELRESISNLSTDLSSEIQDVNTTLTNKIDNVNTTLTNKINSNKSDADNKFSTVNNRLNTIDEQIEGIDGQIQEKLNPLIGKVDQNTEDINTIKEEGMPALDEAVQKLTSDIEAETTRATLAEENLSSRIDDVNSLIDTQVVTNIEDLNILENSIDINYSTRNLPTSETEDHTISIPVASNNGDERTIGLMRPEQLDDIDKIKTDINKQVITNIESFTQYPDRVEILHRQTNINSTSDPVSVINHIPLANTINAGLMGPQDVNSISTLKTDVAALKGGTSTLIYLDSTTISDDNTFNISYMSSDNSKYTVTYTIYNAGTNNAYITPSPESKQWKPGFKFNHVDGDNSKFEIYEYSDFYPIEYTVDIDNHLVTREVNKENINAYAINQNKQAPFEGISVFVESNKHTWRYYEGGDSGWRDDGVSSVAPFTNETAGIIVGKEEDGKIYAESDGVGSVFGWDDLTTAVTNTINKLKTVSYNANKVEESQDNGKLTITNAIETPEGDYSEITSDINVYIHPSGTGNNLPLELYKISTDAQSHIKNAEIVSANDILKFNILHQIQVAVNDWVLDTQINKYKAVVQDQYTITANDNIKFEFKNTDLYSEEENKKSLYYFSKLLSCSVTQNGDFEFISPIKPTVSISMWARRI